MACFADRNALQGSVATYARYDGIFHIHLTANLLRNFLVKFFNRLRFDRIMAMSLWPRFFGLPCTEWRRINLTIQTFNRIYANLHKITPLTLVAHRQIRRQDRKAVHFIFFGN